MRGLPRQPLLWFALIGVALFVIDGRFSTDRHEIYVSAAMQDRLATLWTTQTGLVAGDSEIDALVQNWIREEVMYQEALRLGLDREDSIVRRRLVQKLGFIAESEPTATPEVSALESFYRDNIDNYTLPERYSFRQLFFETIDAAQQGLETIAQAGESAVAGDSTMLNASYAYRSALDLNAAFGFGFADQLRELETGIWQGPISSGFGYHLVQITNIEAEQVSAFDAVRQQVAMDYREYRQETARSAYVEQLLQQYDIVVEPR